MWCLRNSYFLLNFILIQALIPVTVNAIILQENTQNRTSSLSTNLGSFASSSPDWVFVDNFARALPWIPNFCSDHTTLITDENDWVTQLQEGQCASTLIFHQMNGHYPPGDYVLLWQGEGGFELSGDTTYSHIAGNSVPMNSHGLKRAELAVNPSDAGITMEITHVTSDYLKNFRLIMPGGVCGTSNQQLDFFSYCQSERGGEGVCPSDQRCFDFEEVYWDRFLDQESDMSSAKVVFHPKFLELLQPYRAIRFMKWLSNHESRLQHWANRAKLTKQTYGDDADYLDDKSNPARGMPYEIVFALGNILNADVYLNLPAQSTLDFNEQFAKLARRLLNPNLTIYLEYSNEVWNFDYATDRNFMIEQADVRGISGGDSDFAPSGIKIARFYSERALELFNEWKQEFTEQPARLVPLLATFTPDITYTNEILNWNNAYQSINALAIGGYFQGETSFLTNEAIITQWAVNNDLDAVFNELNQGGIGQVSGLDEAKNYMSTHSAIASTLGLRMIAYEGGFGVEDVFDDSMMPVIRQFYQNVSRDPRMGEAMTVNFTNWLNEGGTEFFHYNQMDSNFVYGALEYQNQPSIESPKYTAILNFINNQTCWWSQCQRALLTMLEAALLEQGVVEDVDNAQFRMGLFNNGQLINQEFMSTDDNIMLFANIDVAYDDQGNSADLLIVGGITTLEGNVEFYQKNTSGQFIRWDVNVANLLPYQDNVTLAARHDITLYQGVLFPGIFDVYLGYRLRNGRIVFNRNPFRFEVRSFRKR